jgi:nicotinate-nucleotide adenylyltransferase
MSTAAAPVGMLGGTFDPIHFGHLRLAHEIAEQCGLAQVRLVPGGTPPHRDVPGTPAEARLEMAKLAAAGNRLLVVDDREVRRTGPGYTVDTLLELRAELGAAQPLCLLVGADAFLGFPGWSRWLQLFELAHVVVAGRPGYSLDGAGLPPALAEQAAARVTRERAALAEAPAGRVFVAQIPPLAISATAIRERLAAGRSARYLLPDAVLQYIELHHLYGVQ